MSYTNILTRINAEYLEMPELRLTVDEAQRFFGVERALCQTVLDTLVQRNVLCLKANGAYARPTAGPLAHARRRNI
jgi:hypothetical protein